MCSNKKITQENSVTFAASRYIPHVARQAEEDHRLRHFTTHFPLISRGNAC